ncbi:PssD/Cps14F family polysaccharide biosynthesis glycosyltransferase [Carnobacterium mobile]|uniref:PssD/Cps14F family polysaccharide biosynthesis glycosyltransferase n=1 Tax=Carnobacterium mobile TaxID=2750 RepID=UPI00186610C4|nr:PssD/Cps14F family polysaccharide biosynthesis glycosyltransferase [Carnobacterium mobile]
MKICFVASSGGHLEEIACLKKIEEENDCFLFTEKNAFNELSFCEKVYYTKQTNRTEPLFFINFIKNFLKSFNILCRESPDCVISTGALMTYPICLLGKLMGKKIIYIESFARIDKGSLTGKLMYPIADLFIVQWEELLNVYPKAIFTGGIF